MRDVKLPSGATLKVTASPFADSKALYQAVLREIRNVPVSSKMEMSSLYKDLFCIGFSSPEIEACLWKCFARCLYSGQKITEDTFEPIESRDDYMMVCTEVAKENIGPFGKSLYAEYQRALATEEKDQTSTQKTTTS